mgnify:CR=1 FL=1
MSKIVDVERKSDDTVVVSREESHEELTVEEAEQMALALEDLAEKVSEREKYYRKWAREIRSVLLEVEM